MDWDVRDNPVIEELQMLGARLSLEIGCPVRYPAFDKGLFECKCSITFLPALLKGGRWDLIKEKHQEKS
ncbi:hypothetical protein LCGC14_2453460 [marine sediment metagenome]|uniref:Uncharacterized protein n=1 Tax=marine sediment metagenome TaxID=412755 RepID=A0A0F9DSI6_9ZZZZ